MKLAWCCVAAALLTVTAGAAVDVEKTVQQVQSILQAHSQLPRLSREEIIDLLNDIRAEDAKKRSMSLELSSKASKETETEYNTDENEIYPIQVNDWIQENSVMENKDFGITVAGTTDAPESTTTKESTVMVVLPYTPRDAASLQELYTKPPRTEVLPESKVTPKPLTEKANEKLRETLKNNAELAQKQKLDIPAELQAFLDTHGLKGSPGQDSFLLPLEGFKPLPPAKIVDGKVQLPENILLSYDLVSASDDLKPNYENTFPQQSPNFLYEPLRPQFPFELEASSSEQDQSVLPLEIPKKRNSKPTETTQTPKYAPIEYDAIKVVPLTGGPSPVDDEKVNEEIESIKRQANNSAESENTTQQQESTVQESQDSNTTSTTTTESNDPKDAANDSSAADTNDSGASIADLEESFGGAAPEEPGDSQLPPPKKNGFYWMLDWNSFLEVGADDTKVNIRFEPKLGDPQMFLPVTVP